MDKQRPLVARLVGFLNSKSKKMSIYKSSEDYNALGINYSVHDQFIIDNYWPKRKSYGRSVDVRTEPKVGRNDPCKCGSGFKFKKCCGKS